MILRAARSNDRQARGGWGVTTMKGEKLGGGLWIGQSCVVGILSGALFLRSSEIHPTLLSQCEKLLCANHARYV
jgi:hypothetical protein